jgi:hypothetical protein
MANAFWSPRAGEIILCYEMYAEIVQVFLAAAQGGDKPKGHTRSPTPTPAGRRRALGRHVAVPEQRGRLDRAACARRRWLLPLDRPRLHGRRQFAGGAGRSRAACSLSRSRATSRCSAACRARSTSPTRCPTPTRCRSAWRARRPGCASACSKTCATAPDAAVGIARTQSCPSSPRCRLRISTPQHDEQAM